MPDWDAFAAWAARCSPPALPSAPFATAAPGRPAPIAVDPGLGVDADGLAALARDAAARAWAVLAEDAGTGLELSRDEDLARLSSCLLGGPLLPGLANAAGMTSTALASCGQAWRHAGADGLRVLTRCTSVKKFSSRRCTRRDRESQSSPISIGSKEEQIASFQMHVYKWYW